MHLLNLCLFPNCWHLELIRLNKSHYIYLADRHQFSKLMFYVEIIDHYQNKMLLHKKLLDVLNKWCVFHYLTIHHIDEHINYNYISNVLSFAKQTYEFIFYKFKKNYCCRITNTSQTTSDLHHLKYICST